MSYKVFIENSFKKNANDAPTNSMVDRCLGSSPVDKSRQSHNTMVGQNVLPTIAPSAVEHYPTSIDHYIVGTPFAPFKNCFSINTSSHGLVHRVDFFFVFISVKGQAFACTIFFSLFFDKCLRHGLVYGVDSFFSYL